MAGQREIPSNPASDQRVGWGGNAPPPNLDIGALVAKVKGWLGIGSVDLTADDMYRVWEDGKKAWGWADPWDMRHTLEKAGQTSKTRYMKPAKPASEEEWAKFVAMVAGEIAQE